MRNHVPVLIIVVLISIVGVSAYVVMENPQNTQKNETVDLLNKSGDLQIITNYNDFRNILKLNSTINLKINNNTISKNEMITTYKNIFTNYWQTDDVIVTVDSIGVTEDGRQYYIITVSTQNKGKPETIVFYAFTDVKPVERQGQKLDIDGVHAKFYIDYGDKPDNAKPAFSSDQITQMAKEEYARYNKSADGVKFDTSLQYIGSDPIYSVLINNTDTLRYQGNSGELIYSTLTNDTNDTNNTDYGAICKELAENRLKQEKKDYQSNLSVKYVRNDSGPESLIFYYDIIFKDKSGEQTIGHIVVDAFSRQVINFDITDPVIAPTEENTTEVKEDHNDDSSRDTSHNTREDTSRSSHESSSSSSSSGRSGGSSSSGGSSGGSSSGSSDSSSGSGSSGGSSSR